MYRIQWRKRWMEMVQRQNNNYHPVRRVVATMDYRRGHNRHRGYCRRCWLSVFRFFSITTTTFPVTTRPKAFANGGGVRGENLSTKIRVWETWKTIFDCNSWYQLRCTPSQSEGGSNWTERQSKSYHTFYCKYSGHIFTRHNDVSSRQGEGTFSRIDNWVNL